MAIVLYNPNKNFDINGQKVELVCKNNVCTSLDNYGDKNATRLLAEIGVRKIDKIEKSTNSVIANVYENETSTDGIKILIQYTNSNFSKVTKIVSGEAGNVVYYSSDPAAQIVPFPSLDKITEEKAKAEEEKRKAAEEEAKRQAVEEARLKAEREAKVAEDARYPSEGGTREVCDQAFHKCIHIAAQKYIQSLVFTLLAEAAQIRWFIKLMLQFKTLSVQSMAPSWNV